MAFRRLSKRLMLRIIKHSFLSLLMLGVFIYVAFCFLFLNKSLPNSYFALSTKSVSSRISSLSNSPIALVYLEDKPAVGREGVTKALDAANTLSGKTIVLTYKYDKWPLA